MLCLLEATLHQRYEVDAWDIHCRRRAHRASKGPAPCLLFKPQKMQELSSSVTAQHGSLDSLVVGSQLSKLDLGGIRQNVANHLLEHAGFECDGVYQVDLYITTDKRLERDYHIMIILYDALDSSKDTYHGMYHITLL